MHVIQASTAAPTEMFTLNGLDYAKSNYDIFYTDIEQDASDAVVLNDVKVGIRNKFTNVIIADPENYAGYSPDGTTPYASWDAFWTAISALINFNAASGGSGAGFIVPNSATLPFADNAARDTWAAANLEDLVQNQTVVEVTGSPDNTWYLWRGESDPASYDNSNWIDATPLVRGPQGPAGADSPPQTGAQIVALIDAEPDENLIDDAERSAIATALQNVTVSGQVLTFIREDGTSFTRTVGSSALRPLPPDPAGGVFLDLRPEAEDWDASTGSFPSGASAGYTYVVSAGGTVDGIQFSAHDLLIALVDTPSTSTYADNWQKVEGGVHSWGGLVGVISDQNIIDKLTRLGFVRNSSYAAPSVHNFSINIASRVDLNTDLNVQHTLTYDITNRENISSIVVSLTEGTSTALPTPARDGTQTETATFSGIDSSTSKTLTITLRITDTVGGVHESNAVDILIQDAVAHQQTHFGFIQSTEDQNDIDFSSDDIEARDQADGSWTVSGIPNDSNLYRLYWAVPVADGSITGVTQSGFNLTNQFTAFPNVTIGGQPFNIFLMNAASAVNNNYNGTILISS